MVTVQEFLQRGKPQLWMARRNGTSHTVLPTLVYDYTEWTYQGRIADKFNLYIPSTREPGKWQFLQTTSDEIDEVFSRDLFFTEAEAQQAMIEIIRKRIDTLRTKREALDSEIASNQIDIQTCEKRLQELDET